MENVNLLMGMPSHRKELIQVVGFDDASAGAYSAMERALEEETTEYELENDSQPTSRKCQGVQGRTDATESNKNLLAWIAEYF